MSKQTLLLGDNIEKLRAMPDNSVDAVVTDPPYGLGKTPDVTKMLQAWITTGYMEVEGTGFMGKKWDAFVPQPIFWKEVYRVLKPGGHVLSFFGTRTYDWGVMAMRLAGFEIRDCIQWLYGSGFPKSLDISKAIDKKGGNPMLTKEIACALKEAREKRGITKSKADQMFCGGTTLYSWYEGRPLGIQIPTSEYMRKIADEWPELEKFVGLTQEAERQIVGKYNSDMGGLGGNRLGEKGGNITLPETATAQQWDGWGTALKPANEPIVLARKPLSENTVAENVLKWGTGAINIDDCRISHTEEQKFTNRKQRDAGWNMENTGLDSTQNITASPSPKGRFPANVILDEEAGKILDEQTGILKSGSVAPEGFTGPATNRIYGKFANNSINPDVVYGDSGGASRFFYCAKASKSERNHGVKSNNEFELTQDVPTEIINQIKSFLKIQIA